MELLVDGLWQAFERIASGNAPLYHALAVSLFCTLTAVALAALVAIPYGAWLGFYCPRARYQVALLRLGMAVPTVVIGLVVYALLSNRGLLGGFDLLYTKVAIIAGEFLLAVPLLGAMSHGIAASLDRTIIETSLTHGASRLQALRRALGECRPALIGLLLAAFGRCLTELGIAITVGGNISEETRTLPAAIQLSVRRGEFAAALAPAIVLLALALVVTGVGQLLVKERPR